jgi:peptidyl-prolyl cis-trans isomerase D
MMEALRKAAGTWVAKLLLAILVVSFGVWGISGSIFGGAGSSVLTAGDTSVSVNEYRLAYDRQINVLSRQFGSRVTREQATALGLDQQVLSQLVAGALLDQQASEMKLGLSRDRLAQLTAEDPAFHGPSGSFDRQQFEFVLRQVGMRPEDYLKNREQVAVRQQIVEAVSDGMQVPDTFLRAVALYSGEDRTVDFIKVPPSAVGEVPAPTDDQLKTYFEANKSKYAAPEYRKISFVRLEPGEIADETAISDEEVKSYYDKNVSRFTQPEQRTIEQLVFASEADAKAALDEIRAGKSFEDAVKAQGKTMDDVKLGTFPRDRVADPAIAEAAFSLQQGAVSDVVKGSFGYLLVRVPEIKAAVVKPFAEVEHDIRRDLALDEANRVLLDVHDSYEDARAGGASMQEAASKLKLNVRTVEAVDAEGLAPDGNPVPNLPEKNDLLRQAFATEVNVENPPVQSGANGFVYYEVDGITPARDRTLDEVRDRVATDWKAQEASTRLDALVADLHKQLDDGKPFAEIASGLGLEVQTKRGLKRNADDGDLGTAGSSAAFGVKQGGTGVVAAPDKDGQILFKVTEVFPPLAAGPEAVPDQTKQSLASGMSDDLLDELVAKLRNLYPVRVNQAAINQALSF